MRGRRQRARRGALALVVVLAATAAQAQSLGRLFHTPAQRAALDRQRATGAAAPDDILAVQGSVARSGRRGTVWINGTPYREAAAGSGLEVTIVGADAAHVRVAAAGEPPALVRVGERVDRRRDTRNDAAAPAPPLAGTAPESRR